MLLYVPVRADSLLYTGTANLHDTWIENALAEEVKATVAMHARKTCKHFGISVGVIRVMVMLFAFRLELVPEAGVRGRTRQNPQADRRDPSASGA